MRRRDFLQASLLAVAAGAGCAAPAPSRRVARSLVARGVDRAVPGYATVDGAGVSLVRQLGQPILRHLDPFVLLDQIHADDPAAYVRGFPNHPHRGFETVTVMLDGRMRHHDSRGNGGLITGGGAQWVTAGRGIVHSEMPEQEHGPLWGFQLWVNLPRAEKWCAPQYQDLPPDRLAEVVLDRGGTARLIAGEALGARGPVAARATQPLLVSLRMMPREDVELRVQRDANVMVLVADGDAEVGPRRDRVRDDELAILDARGELVRLRAGARGAQILLAAGQPIGEPIVQRGPFVMNSDAEIDQAWEDYRAGTLG